MNTEKIAADKKDNSLESIKTIYLLLSRMFLKEVDADLLSQFQSKEMAPLLSDIGIDLSGEDDELLQELSAEYTAIFIAPGAMPPYQSVAESGRFLADAADKLELFYQECGFEYRKEYPKLFPDHLGIQLSFIASLVEGEIKAMEAGNTDNAAELFAYRKNFFEKHLGKWYASYFERLLEGVEHPFYRSVVEFTHAFLDSEAEQS